MGQHANMGIDVGGRLTLWRFESEDNRLEVSIKVEAQDSKAIKPPPRIFLPLNVTTKLLREFIPSK
jgi:hypothetical protein